MIPALIIWLCKKYLANRTNRETPHRKLLNLRSIALVLLLSFSAPQVFAQTSKFSIKRNGAVIGQMSFLQDQDGENVLLKMNSKVNTRFLFKIAVETQDFSHFKNGQLQTSSVRRVVNGNIKDPKDTKWINDAYQTSSGNKSGTIRQPINYNMMLLYAKEPLNISQVYSDSFQCFLPIIKSGAHQYRINLPDGNYNDYFFENGICMLVKVNHSLYTISMERI